MGGAGGAPTNPARDKGEAVACLMQAKMPKERKALPPMESMDVTLTCRV